MATRHLDQEQERKQRLSPVSVMDFLSQDEDDGDEHENGNGGGEDDDEAASPTFQRSIANIRSKAFRTSFSFILKGILLTTLRLLR